MGERGGGGGEEGEGEGRGVATTRRAARATSIGSQVSSLEPMTTVPEGDTEVGGQTRLQRSKRTGPGWEQGSGRATPDPWAHAWS